MNLDIVIKVLKLTRVNMSKLTKEGRFLNLNSVQGAITILRH